MENGENGNKVIGTLVRDDRGDWVTYSGAKKQVRDAAKAAGLEIGTFTPRGESRNTVKVPLKDGSGWITADRKVGAQITVIRAVPATSIDQDTMAKILADGARGQARLEVEERLG